MTEEKNNRLFSSARERKLPETHRSGVFLPIVVHSAQDAQKGRIRLKFKVDWRDSAAMYYFRAFLVPTQTMRMGSHHDSTTWIRCCRSECHDVTDEFSGGEDRIYATRRSLLLQQGWVERHEYGRRVSWWSFIVASIDRKSEWEWVQIRRDSSPVKLRMRWWRRTRTENYSNVIASRWMSTGCVLVVVVFLFLFFLFPEKNFLLRLVWPERLSAAFSPRTTPTSLTFITSAMQREPSAREKEKEDIDLRVHHDSRNDKEKRKESAVAALSKNTR